ncbi:hypothetical protein RRG08_034537 [Elysia crispata]|uniref:Uncharacterized protein n=1 Tax=Elysia crispata TaxID=231223 RepID=A0AAE1EDY2_9GAST|nr:hypothetical protein RRG08_034537 [Elysia crispata]
MNAAASSLQTPDDDSEQNCTGSSDQIASLHLGTLLQNIHQYEPSYWARSDIAIGTSQPHNQMVIYSLPRKVDNARRLGEPFT